jgi:hypothetical protein
MLVAAAERVRTAALAASAIGALDLALRLVARRGLLRLTFFDSDPSPAAVLAAVLICAAAGVAAARLSRRSPIALVLAGAMAAGLFAQAKLGARLQSDGFYYYAYLRSLAFDRDVDLANDYRLLGLDDAPHRFLFQPTATGHAQSAWSIGPAIAWSPFFAAGHAVARHLARGGEAINTNGTAYPYRQAVVVAGLFYGLLGLWFTYRFVRLFRSAPEAIAGVVLTAAGSFVLWYLVREPTMSHALSMAAVAGFLWCWAAGRDRRSSSGWLLLGLAGGVMALMRWQNILMFVLPAVDLLRAMRVDARRAALAGAILALGAAVGFAPQMLAWHAIYGHWLARSPVGPELYWFHPQIVDVLWSSRNGLFAWSPVFIPAVVGLAALTRREPLVAWSALAIFAAMTWVNGAVDDWWGGAGFGMRRFDSLVPFAALGVSVSIALAARAIERRPQLLVAGALASLTLWNLSFMAVAAGGGGFRLGEPVSFGDVGGRQAALLHHWFGHVFSYPANLAYAAGNGVAPWRFDLLRANRFLGEARRPYGRIDIGGPDDGVYLGDGWYAPEEDGPITFRWAGSTAHALVPLDHAATLTVQLRLRAFAYAGAAEQTVLAEINGHSYGPVAVGNAWQTVELATAREHWRSGVNRVRLDFAWARRPLDVGVSGDARILAAAVDYVRVAVSGGFNTR